MKEHEQRCIYSQYDGLTTEELRDKLDETAAKIKEIEEELGDCKNILDPLKVQKLRDLKEERTVLKLKAKSSKIKVISTGSSTRRARRHPDVDALNTKKRGSANTRPKKRRKKR